MKKLLRTIIILGIIGFLGYRYWDNILPWIQEHVTGPITDRVMELLSDALSGFSDSLLSEITKLM